LSAYSFASRFGARHSHASTITSSRSAKDLVEADEHSGVAVEMRRGEEDLRLVG